MKTDAQIEKEYREAMGLDCQDASRQFFLKKAKAIGKAKGYRMSGYNQLKVNQLMAITNKV